MLHTENNSITFSGILILVLVSFVLSSCEDFLGQRPSKSSDRTVETVKDLDLIFDAYTNFYRESNRAAIHSTDDYGMTTDLWDADPTWNFNGMLHTLWDTEYIPREGSSFWSGEFDKIFRANMVLENLGDVSGSEDVKAKLRAEAHFVRAYSYWVLAQTFTLPYTDANADEPGLPIQRSTSFEESLDRGTVEELYQFIEADLQEALKISEPLMRDGTPTIWRANTAAVNAFAARFYLQQHNYTEALNYANEALDEYDQLSDYNTDMSYGVSQDVTIDPGTPQESTYTIEYPYTHDNRILLGNLTPVVEWGESYYLKVLDNPSWWYVPSQDLLDLYDQNNDLRYEYHIVEGYSYDRGMTSPSYQYPGYIDWFKNAISSGPSVPEMYLVKAEAQARTNSVGPAMNTVNDLYSTRVEPGTSPLTAGNQAEAIEVILEERRRELAFTHRWWDIRRLNTNDNPDDDIVPEKTFYPFDATSVLDGESPINYVLEKNSRRYAVPIPEEEITTSEGTIEQNTY